MIKKLILVAAILTLYLQSNAQITSEVYIYKNIPIVIKISSGDPKEVKNISDKIFEIITNELNNYEYNEESYIKNITENAYKKPTKISKDLNMMLGKILYYHSLTKAVSPTIGYLIDLWGFDEGRFYIPSPKEISNALKISSVKNLVIYEDTIILKNKKTKFYLKPFAVGLSAEKIRRLLIKEKVENAIISIGNNFSLCLGKKNNKKWNVAINKSYNNIEKEEILNIEVSDEAVYTASIYENAFIDGFKVYHPIIDPKTGYPADNKTILVTVVHKDPIEAIILSRALLVMGKDAGIKFSEKMGIKSLFLTIEDNKTRIYKTSNWIKTFDKDTSQKPYKK
ncbi:MAG: FAD:protein FMN transferase [Brevinematia bacterium]